MSGPIEILTHFKTEIYYFNKGYHISKTMKTKPHDLNLLIIYLPPLIQRMTITPLIVYFFISYDLTRYTIILFQLLCSSFKTNRIILKSTNLHFYKYRYTCTDHLFCVHNKILGLRTFVVRSLCCLCGPLDSNLRLS